MISIFPTWPFPHTASEEITSFPERVQQAIKQNDFSIFNSLEGDWNAPLPNGELPLHFAVREGKVGCLIPLILRGADVLKKDFQNLTAIDHAILMNNVEACHLLIVFQLKDAFSNPDAFFQGLEDISREIFTPIRLARMRIANELQSSIQDYKVIQNL